MQAEHNSGAATSKDTIASAGEFVKGRDDDNEKGKLTKGMTEEESGLAGAKSRGYETYTFMSKEDQSPSGKTAEESPVKGRDPMDPGVSSLGGGRGRDVDSENKGFEKHIGKQDSKDKEGLEEKAEAGRGEGNEEDESGEPPATPHDIGMKF